MVTPFDHNEKQPILSGTTPRIEFPIVDEDGVGFKPTSLTMSIYDEQLGPGLLVTQSIVNSRNDVDVLSSCDDDGNVSLSLAILDTTITVPVLKKPATYERRVVFVWTWELGAKQEKQLVILNIAPDRETAAT